MNYYNRRYMSFSLIVWALIKLVLYFLPGGHGCHLTGRMEAGDYSRGVPGKRGSQNDRDA